MLMTSKGPDADRVEPLRVTKKGHNSTGHVAEDQQALHKPAAHDSAQRTVEEEMRTKLQGGAATPTGGRR